MRAAGSSRSEPAVSTSARGGLLGAPQHGLDPGHHLARREGLGQVVVAADLQPDDPVDLVVARGHEQHRRPVAALAQPPAQLDAVEVGQPDVEDDQHGLETPYGLQAGGPAGLDVHAVPRLAEVPALQLCDRRLVLHDEHQPQAFVTHGETLVARPVADGGVARCLPNPNIAHEVPSKGMRAVAVAAVALLLSVGTACTVEESAPAPAVAPTSTASTPAASPTPSETAQPVEPVEPAEPAVLTSTNGRPREATLSIPALKLSGLRVVAYAGTPDDAPGTAIQDRGFAASPHGSGGLVGPGGIGNYLITGHRSSSTAPFRYLPSVRLGARIIVETGSHRLVYEVVATRQTSFRSARSLRQQSAAVPGQPGREPTRAMITLSTCATFEDHAAGNYWSDEFHNPEHRIEKIGVLRSVRRV